MVFTELALVDGKIESYTCTEDVEWFLRCPVLNGQLGGNCYIGCATWERPSSHVKPLRGHVARKVRCVPLRGGRGWT